ncbi:MAG TPA: ATP-grasp domain-containing protein [Casimicrobiaceae bacterium]|nr:ATP-grasp domain-containing protein [Casimicrobiaceae bacterium]
MTISALLVASSSNWIGPARMPKALADAGFDVHLLAPPDSLIAESRFLVDSHRLPADATVLQWVEALAAAVDATSPRILFPCDDLSFRLLRLLAILPPPGVPASMHLRLSALVRSSLGDPRYYQASIDKTLLPEAALALGVRVPRSTVCAGLAAAEAFALEHGFPVVLKRRHSSFGGGVAICASYSELATAFAALIAADQADDLGNEVRGHLLVQEFIAGSIEYYAIAAWRGTLLVGYAASRVVGNPEPKGPATVTRYHRSPAMREFARRLVEGFGMSGLLGLECVLANGSGELYLIEINRRIVPGTHRGRELGVDQCAALHAALDGLPNPTRTDLEAGEEVVRVSFPQEWLRDPQSRWLREYPVDVPWGELELLTAMLARRRAELDEAGRTSREQIDAGRV